MHAICRPGKVVRVGRIHVQFASDFVVADRGFRGKSHARVVETRNESLLNAVAGTIDLRTFKDDDVLNGAEMVWDLRRYFVEIFDQTRDIVFIAIVPGRKGSCTCTGPNQDCIYRRYEVAKRFIIFEFALLMFEFAENVCKVWGMYTFADEIELTNR